MHVCSSSHCCVWRTALTKHQNGTNARAPCAVGSAHFQSLCLRAEQFQLQPSPSLHIPWRVVWLHWQSTAKLFNSMSVIRTFSPRKVILSRPAGPSSSLWSEGSCPSLFHVFFLHSLCVGNSFCNTWGQHLLKEAQIPQEEISSQYSQVFNFRVCMK